MDGGARARPVARGLLVLTIFFALAFVLRRLAWLARRKLSRQHERVRNDLLRADGNPPRARPCGRRAADRARTFPTQTGVQADQQAAVEAIAYYWHFVFIVWIALWATIYLIK